MMLTCRPVALTMPAVTVEVSTKDAQKLTLAAGAGQLSLALRQVASNEGEVTDRITLTDLTGETPADVAARQADVERQLAEEEARRRAEEQIDGIRQVVESVGTRLETRIGSVEERLNQADKDEPEVREVVRVVQPKRPANASVNVWRGLEREAYDVPRRE